MPSRNGALLTSWLNDGLLEPQLAPAASDFEAQAAASIKPVARGVRDVADSLITLCETIDAAKVHISFPKCTETHGSSRIVSMINPNTQGEPPGQFGPGGTLGLQILTVQAARKKSGQPTAQLVLLLPNRSAAYSGEGYVLAQCGLDGLVQARLYSPLHLDNISRVRYQLGLYDTERLMPAGPTGDFERLTGMEHQQFVDMLPQLGAHLSRVAAQQAEPQFLPIVPR